ncbi:MAG: hypothetical protein JSS14_23045 [Proteobacteria bacterium]|nr:hypothetical protein [Pseudomonadota bacterium]
MISSDTASLFDVILELQLCSDVELNRASVRNSFLSSARFDAFWLRSCHHVTTKPEASAAIDAHA